MTEEFIATVPPRIWQEGRPADASHWSAPFNVACWVKVIGSAGLVGLQVRYFDGREPSCFPVDKVSAVAGQSMLLAGVVTLPLSASLARVEIVLSLPAETERYVVEELYMQRQAAQVVSDSKMISTF